jgi:opacity protein-like surface antigen
MKLKLACTTLAIGLMAAIVTPAIAGDMISAGPGVKYVPRGVAVPVPAPSPIDNYPARWYFRLDAALGIRGDSPFHESGFVFGAPQPGGSGTFRSRPGWFTNDSDVYAGFGAGVGYYFSRQLRGDITVETRGQNKFGGTRTQNYTLGGTTESISYKEDTRYTSVPVLFNLYWDFARRWGGFKPYVGLGLGFSVNELERGVTISDTGGLLAGSASAKAHDVSFAAMGTVGATYEVDPSWALDFNYRMLYVGGSDVGLGIGGAGSRAFVGDQLDHQFRAGVRFNIY